MGFASFTKPIGGFIESAVGNRYVGLAVKASMTPYGKAAGAGAALGGISGGFSDNGSVLGGATRGAALGAGALAGWRGLGHAYNYGIGARNSAATFNNITSKMR